MTLTLLVSAFFSATERLAGTALAEKIADCEIDKGPCSKMIDTTEVILNINPKPVKAMRELSFALTLIAEGKEISAIKVITLDLSMPGMYMGRNSVILEKGGPFTFSGKGVIPRCPSGKRLWQATVKVPKIGSASFLFNVGY